MNDLNRMKQLAGMAGYKPNVTQKIKESLTPDEEGLFAQYRAGEISREHLIASLESNQATDRSMRQGEMGMMGDDTPAGNRAWDRDRGEWDQIDMDDGDGMDGDNEYDELTGELEEGIDSGLVEQMMARLTDLLSSGVDAQEAIDVIQQEMDQEGLEADQQDHIMDMMTDKIGNDSAVDDDMGPLEEVSGPNVSPTDELSQAAYRNKWEDGSDTMEEAYDLNNGYGDIHSTHPENYFPDGAANPAVSSTGMAGARMGDNPMQKKAEIAEAHKELVYNYRQFLKESKSK